MSDYTLNIPDEVYRRARQIANETSQPVDQLMVDYLRTLLLPLPALPPDEAAELDALKHLSDDALWTIAREQLPQAVQERMQALMDKNNLGTVTDVEFAELEALVERGNRLMVRKAEAAGLLAERGQAFSQTDFAQDE
jgi:hypothetical protein